MLFLLFPAANDSEIPVALLTDPLGPVFPAAIYINFDCIPLVSLPDLSYAWTLFCPEDPTGDIDLNLSPTTTSIRVWSTAPIAACLSGVRCTVTDAVGNQGSTDFIISNITGE